MMKCDSMREWQTGMQDGGTAVQEGIMRFNGDLMGVMIYVVVFVSVILGRIVYMYRSEEVGSKEVHGATIEIVWTVVPALILMVIAVPSFTLLYAVEEVVEPSVTVKVVGHQWYWTYEHSDGEGIEYESYMIGEEELGLGELRILEVDNRMVVPAEAHIRLVVTAGDVLHSWAVPGFGIKIDGCPGRLNEVSMYVKRPGVYYGQCSELCGVNHGFMPIGVDVVWVEDYIRWAGGDE